MKNRATHSVPLSVLCASLIIAGAHFVSAQESVQESTHDSTLISSNSITYPIPELGNCADRGACRYYCNQPANITACIAFAEAHGLASPSEAVVARSFGQALVAGQGPGGCTDPLSCKQFCSALENISVCAAFAKANGHSTERVSDAEKIASYVQEGGVMPGNCTHLSQCQMYCADFSHAEECAAFAEKLDLSVPQGKNAIAPGQFQKVISLAKEGKTPGQCTNQFACKEYCADAAHRSECVLFAKEAGILPPEKADSFLSGPIGPGGCTSKESCRLYCDDQAHRDECFAFARENGLLSEEAAKIAQEGILRLRAGLSNAPEAVRLCLQNTLSAGVLEKIQNGTLTPNQEVGEAVKKCFSKFGGNSDVRSEVANAPTPVAICIKEKLGEGLVAGKSEEDALTPEKADVIRACTEQHRLLNMQENSMSSVGENTDAVSSESTADSFARFLKNAPAPVAQCVRENLGERLQIVLSGKEPVSSTREVVTRCVNAFTPGTMNSLQRATPGGATDVKGLPSQPAMPPSQERIMPTKPIQPIPPIQQPVQSSGARPSFAPEVVACFKARLAPYQVEQVMQGVLSETRAREVVSLCFQEYNQASQKTAPGTINSFGAPNSTLPTPSPATNVSPAVEEYDLPSVDSYMAPDIEWGEESSVVRRAVASILVSILNFLEPNGK